MIVLAFFLIGLALGAMRARARKGNPMDMAQYGLTYGLIFAVVGVFATLIVQRMV